jgi:hypothetical protein
VKSQGRALPLALRWPAFHAFRPDNGVVMLVKKKQK